jgi:biotin carboxylase
MVDNGSTPLLLLVGSGNQRYREYILSALAGAYRLWLLDTAEPTWQEQYLVGATCTEINDARAIADASRELAATAGSPHGLLCYDEFLVPSAAAAADLLDLPGPRPEAIAACRDKAATRRVLRAAGVPQPRSIPVATPEEAAAAAAEIGYPVVLKARAQAGSLGVIRVDEAAGVEAAFTAAASASWHGVKNPHPPVLVEDYLDGPEISVDSAVTAEGAEMLVVARKQIGLDPYFEEVGHVVDASDPLLSDPELQELLTLVHETLGLAYAATHSEFRLTPLGPRLVEVNPRLGGDLIPYLGLLAGGVDCARAAAEVALGRAPRVRRGLPRAAGIRFLYPPYDCRVNGITVRDRLSPAIVEATITAKPGQLLQLPPRAYLSRYGYVIAVADTPAEVQKALEAPEEILVLDAQSVAA